MRHYIILVVIIILSSCTKQIDSKAIATNINIIGTTTIEYRLIVSSLQTKVTRFEEYGLKIKTEGSEENFEEIYNKAAQALNSAIYEMSTRLSQPENDSFGRPLPKLSDQYKEGWITFGELYAADAGYIVDANSRDLLAIGAMYEYTKMELVDSYQRSARETYRRLNSQQQTDLKNLLGQVKMKSYNDL